MLNVKALWTRSGNGEAEPADYLRAISTGPACPLVLAVTAIGDVLEVGLSYRRDAFSSAMVEEVRTALQRSLAALRGGTHG